MWLIKHSRTIVQFLLVLAYGAIAMWGVKNNHRWVALFAFVAYFSSSALIVPKLPRPVTQPMTTRSVLLMLASAARFVSIVVGIACILLLASHPFLSNPLPIWALVPVALVWLLWACGSFWLYKWLKNKASELDSSQTLVAIPPAESRDKN